MLFDFSLQFAQHFINTAQLILSGLLAINIFTAYLCTKKKRQKKCFLFVFLNKEHSVVSIKITLFQSVPISAYAICFNLKKGPGV